MIPDFKICPRCKVNKPASEYNLRKDRDYIYLKSYCKQCSNANKSESLYDLCECGSKKQSRSKQCLKCSKKNNTKYNTIGEAIEVYSEKYNGKKMYEIVRSRIRKRNINILKDQCCQNCAYSKHVEICHIKPVASFELDTPIDIINSPDNILYLCRNCHWEFDNNLLDIKNLGSGI